MQIFKRKMVCQKKSLILQKFCSYNEREILAMKGAWNIMQGDTFNTTIASIIATFCSFVIAHLPEIQAFITFSLTVAFLIYKIREAKAKALEAEEHQVEEHKRHENSD